MKKMLFQVFEFGEIQYLPATKKLVPFLLLLFITFYSTETFSQNPITSSTTITETATPSSYSAGGQTYNWGQGNNIILETITYNGETYFLDNTFTQTSYSIVRVNGNGGVSYDKFGIYAQRTTTGGGAPDYNYAPSLPSPMTMENLLDSPVINRGANDVFKNDSGQSTSQNIERIDVLYVPFKIPNLPNLEKVGFIATEKDGNSSYKCAVVTSLDSSGNPATFGPVITILGTDYGTVTSIGDGSNNDVEFDLFVNSSAGANPTYTAFNDQNVGVTFISLSDLGIGTNDIVYGISFFDSNVANNADLLDVANNSVFPDVAGEGADINGGLGAIVTSIGTVSGTVYLDIDGDGTQDANEPGLENISVTILGSDGAIQNVVTNSDGGYSAFVSGGNTTVTIDETDPDLPPNFSRTEGTNPTVVFAIEGQDVSIGNTGYTSDIDNDGVIDLDDIDDDNDGILDTTELTIGATTYDPLGDEDGDTIVNYLDNSDDGIGDASTTDYTDTNSDGIPDVFDFDNDGVPNHLDLDADNDGIPDNIEAQTTNDYIALSGEVGSGFTDVDGDGLDDNYDPVVSGGSPGTAITPVNSDSATVTDNPDYLDLDSDEDGISDTTEANLSLSGTVGDNGLDNFYDNGDDYTDVNGNFDDTQTDNFPDDGNNASSGLPNDVDWRDNAVTGEIDTDWDGIPNSVDIDDDNDGILDIEESTNIATSGTASMSSTLGGLAADNAIDGDTAGTNGASNIAHTGNVTTTDWWEVDLGSEQVINEISIFNRDDCCQNRLGNVYVLVSDTPFPSDPNDLAGALANADFTYQLPSTETGDPTISLPNVTGRYVRLQKSGTNVGGNAINIAEVQVFNSLDTDNDGIYDHLDLDADNDGIPDNIEAQPTTGYVAATGGVGANGLYDVYENNDTLTATSYTVENTDGTDNPDYIDLDSDNDGTSDRIEANNSLSSVVGANGLDSNYEASDDYTDVNGNFDDTPFNDFPDNPSGGEIDWRDDTSSFSDNDGDGVPDATDLDDDNDGILDTVEGLSSLLTEGGFNGLTTPNTNANNVGASISPWVLESGTDTNVVNVDGPGGGTYGSGPESDATGGAGNYFDVSGSGGVIYQTFTITETSVVEYGGFFSARDGSSGDGTISIYSGTGSGGTQVSTTGATTYNDDENWSQTSNSVTLTPGTYSFVVDMDNAVSFDEAYVNASPDTDGDGFPNHLDLDVDNDGIPDNIEGQTTQGYGPADGVVDANGVDTAYTGGLTPVDTDLDGEEDYIETDSDNDGLLDNVEAGLTLTGVYGSNGLDNAYDNGDNYLDVNGSFDNSQTDNFPDLDFDVFNTGDVDYRDDTFTIDIDQDGIPNEDDLDDDNDGILDTEEGLTALLTEDGFNDLVTPSLGDNTGASISPWILESGTDTNVIQVDGPGGTTYGAGGPEFDATGEDGNYFTIDGSDGVIYQTFTLTETSTVDYGGYISSRDGNTAEGSISIYSGTGSGGTIISSTGTKITSADSTWKKIGNSVVLPAGTYSLVVEMDEDLNFDEIQAFSSIDSDGDGVVNHYDLDADNDGIPDNIEAQTTAGYIAPSGSYSLTGIDLAYGTGLTPVNTDGTDEPDYLDLDSDNEGGFDIVESGAGLTDANTDGVADGAPSAFGNNGLINTLETGDVDTAYTDVNGEYDVTFTTILTDTDGDVNIGGDLDYRDDIVGVDTDNDGIANADDIDDDNDGILDVNETSANTFVTNVDAFWNLDNTADDAENSNDSTGGTLPTFVTDNVVEGTHAADFNGSTNEIQYSSGGFMTSAYTDVSFSAWINPDDVSGTSIIYEEGGSTNGLTLWIDNGVLTFSTRSGGAGSQRNVTHPTLLTSTGEWQHVAATFNDGILTVYVNGVPETLDITADYTSIPSHGDSGGIGGQLGNSNSGGTSGNYDGLMDAVRYSNSETWSSADILSEVNNATDADGDGVINSLDIDADNDGIPDNVEAQTTLGYESPLDADDDNDGLDNRYDATPNGLADGTGSLGITPNNHDGTDNPDYIDTDSDNDGIFDIAENNVSNGSDTTLDSNTGTSTDGTPDGTIDPSNFVDTDNDGLADVYEGSDLNDPLDVNDEINTPSTDLPDEDSDVAIDDVDYRDDTTDAVPPSTAGNVLWLRADIAVTGTSTVTQWDDQSDGGFIAEDVATFEPTKIDNGVNFNPTIDFSPNDRLRITGGIFGNASYTNLWTYYVINPNTATTNTIGRESGSVGQYLTGIDGGDLNQTIGAGSQTETITGLTGEFGLYTLGSSNTATSTPSENNQTISKNGLVIGSNNTPINFTSNNDTFDLGSNNNSSNFFDGQLAEIIIINETPSSLKQQQIESYLAIKYGITLDVTDNDPDITEGNYILQDLNTTIWDYDACQTYHNDVAGIGRDDAMMLNQKQSKSINSDAIITVGLQAIASTNVLNANTFDSNKDFLVWGNDNGSLLEADVTETELICAPEKTLERVWKIKETGSVGSVEITADQATIDAALTTPNTIKVLKVADDGALTTNVDYVPLTLSGSVYTADYDFNGTKYFTYSEINGIFWNGNETVVADRWKGGNSASVTGGPSTNIADVDKVMVIDSEGTSNHATLAEDVEVECVWIKENSKLMVLDNKYLEFDEDFILDGDLKLIGNGQLVQTHTGLSNVQGTGRLFRDQAAVVPSIYRYHYWTSPVRELNLDTFRVGEVMFDGNDPTSENSEIRPIDWTGDGNIYDGAPGTVTPDVPIKIAPYWIYTYLNGTTQADWVQTLQTGVLQRGQGYSMKSTGVVPQNFTFIGTPNDGSITFDFISNTTNLLGNPYASALDATDFINSNLSKIDGTLYFWEHTGEDNVVPATSEGHNLTGYQGGYSQRNLAMGVAANNVPTSVPILFGWEDASVIDNKVTQAEDGVITSIELSSGTIALNDIDLDVENEDYAVENEDGVGTYTINVSFNQKVDLESVKLYSKVLGTTPVNVTLTTSGNPENGDVSATLTNTVSLVIDQTISVSWEDVTGFEISSDSPFDIGLNDISLKKGNLPGLGDPNAYHAPNRYIAVAQGFFVSASNAGGTVRFENSMRAFEDNVYVDNDEDGSGSGTYFFKTNSKSKKEEDENKDLLPVLKLGFNHIQSNDINLHRQVGISFRRGNDFRYDNGYDSEIYDLGATDFYWNFPEFSDKNLIIAGVSEITNNLRVPIIFKVDTDNPILIQIDQIKNISKKVFIEDALTGEFYELSKDNLIELNIDRGTYNNRFYLTFDNDDNSLSTKDNILNKELDIFLDNDDKKLILENRNGIEIKTIEVYNILGQKVKEFTSIEKQASNSFPIKELSATVYIVKVLSEQGILSKKILIE